MSARMRNSSLAARRAAAAAARRAAAPAAWRRCDGSCECRRCHRCCFACCFRRRSRQGSDPRTSGPPRRSRPRGTNTRCQPVSRKTWRRSAPRCQTRSTSSNYGAIVKQLPPISVFPSCFVLYKAAPVKGRLPGAVRVKIKGYGSEGQEIKKT